MRVLILDTVYRDFLFEICKKFSAANPEFNERQAQIFSSRFGTSDSYSFYLKKIDVEAEEFLCNDPRMLNFFSENLNRYFITRPGYHLAKIFGLFERLCFNYIKRGRFDIIHCQDIHFFSSKFLYEIKDYCRLLVGQIAAPLPASYKLRQFDLLLSSLPNFVDYFLQEGMPSEYFRLGFDKRVLRNFVPTEKKYDVIFVGGLGRHHVEWIDFLERVAEHCNLKVFGYGFENIPKNSILRERHGGTVWGLDMYAKLSASKIALNRHISISGRYANNMRLYEATGMGSLLLTDAKDNLDTLFDVGSQVLSYDHVDDAVAQVQFYLNNWDLGLKIARAGQKRTLNDHGYDARMLELKKIYERRVQ